MMMTLVCFHAKTGVNTSKSLFLGDSQNLPQVLLAQFLSVKLRYFE